MDHVKSLWDYTVQLQELSWRYGYLGVIAICLIIVISGILWFRKKKWL